MEVVIRQYRFRPPRICAMVVVSSGRCENFFDPGVRELGDLRSLAVDCFSLFGLHLGFEGRNGLS
jgi:hypothetical protein